MRVPRGQYSHALRPKADEQPKTLVTINTKSRGVIDLVTSFIPTMVIASRNGRYSGRARVARATATALVAAVSKKFPSMRISRGRQRHIDVRDPIETRTLQSTAPNKPAAVIAKPDVTFLGEPQNVPLTGVDVFDPIFTHLHLGLLNATEVLRPVSPDDPRQGASDVPALRLELHGHLAALTQATQSHFATWAAAILRSAENLLSTYNDIADLGKRDELRQLGIRDFTRLVAFLDKQRRSNGPLSPELEFAVEQLVATH